ncbi:unnamed protein product [Prunus armeniaca]
MPDWVALRLRLVHAFFATRGCCRLLPTVVSCCQQLTIVADYYRLTIVPITKFTSTSIPWCGSEVHKKRFLVNLHHVTSEAHFQKWCATYAYAIPDDVHVKLAASSTDDVPCVDSKDLNARIITFHPFYFSLCFTFPLSKFFRKVFCTMDCAPSQCTSNVYRVIMCSENLSSFFKLDLTM